MSLLLALAPPCTAPAPLSCVPHGDAVRISLLSSGPSAVIPSSTFSDPSKSSALPLLHPSLASSLSSGPSLSRRSPHSPSLLTWYWYWPRITGSVSSVFLPYAVVVFFLPFMPRCAAVLLLPWSTLPLWLFSPLSLAGPCGRLPRPLRPFPRPRPPILPVGKNILAIVRAGLLCTGWWREGGSAPRGKIPSRPLAVMGDGISRPLFLHLPQQ